jgi:hypothetical protein
MTGALLQIPVIGIGLEEFLLLVITAAARGALGLPIERDEHFAPTHTLSVYARAARAAAGITEHPKALDAAAKAARAGGQS